MKVKKNIDNNNRKSKNYGKKNEKLINDFKFYGNKSSLKNKKKLINKKGSNYFLHFKKYINSKVHNYLYYSIKSLRKFFQRFVLKKKRKVENIKNNIFFKNFEIFSYNLKYDNEYNFNIKILYFYKPLLQYSSKILSKRSNIIFRLWNTYKFILKNNNYKWIHVSKNFNKQKKTNLKYNNNIFLRLFINYNNNKVISYSKTNIKFLNYLKHYNYNSNNNKNNLLLLYSLTFFLKRKLLTVSENICLKRLIKKNKSFLFKNKKKNSNMFKIIKHINDLNIILKQKKKYFTINSKLLNIFSFDNWYFKFINLEYRDIFLKNVKFLKNFLRFEHNNILSKRKNDNKYIEIIKIKNYLKKFQFKYNFYLRKLKNWKKIRKSKFLWYCFFLVKRLKKIYAYKTMLIKNMSFSNKLLKVKKNVKNINLVFLNIRKLISKLNNTPFFKTENKNDFLQSKLNIWSLKKKNFLKWFFIKLFLQKFLLLNFNIRSQIILKNVLLLYIKHKTLLFKHNLLTNSLIHFSKRITYFKELLWLFRIGLDLNNFYCFLKYFLKEWYYADSMKQRFFLTFFKSLLTYFYKLKFYFFKGFRILISGKLFQNPRKSKYNLQIGELRFTNIDQNIHYLFYPCNAKFGTFGVKIWWSAVNV